MEVTENGLWEQLYLARVNALRERFVQSDLPSRGSILTGLDSLIQGRFETPMPEFAKSRKAAYVQAICSGEVRQQVLDVINESTHSQITGFIDGCLGLSITDLAREIGIPDPSLRSELHRFKENGYLGKGYNCTKLAHYLVEKGFKLGQ